MDILTMLRADMRKKKGAFISIVLLTFLIVTMVSSLLSVQRNFKNAYAESCKYYDIPDVSLILKESRLTDDMRESINACDCLERADIEECLTSNGIMSVGDCTDGNTYMFFRMHENMRIFNESATGYETEDIVPGKGEIFIPFGLKDKLNCNIGDTLKLSVEQSSKQGPTEFEFTIKRFVEEPVLGANMIGWKKVFVCDEEYDSLMQAFEKYESEDYSRKALCVGLYKSDPDMTDLEFQREVNKASGIADCSFGVLPKGDSAKYTSLFMEIVTNVMIGFSVLLFTIVLVMIAHSIKTEIEIDYVDLGVIKSQGFGSGKISAVILLRYLLAEFIGILLGLAAGVPLERLLSEIFFGITAVLPKKGIAIGSTMLCVLGLLVISVLIVFICTRKISRISPVRAINGGKNEIYFSSRLNAPISPKLLTLSIAFRSFTSNKKRYIGTVFIAALLTFFAVTANILKDMITSRSALDLMGFLSYDLLVDYNDEGHPEIEQQVYDIVEKYTTIKKKYNYTQLYASLNGDKIMMQIYQYPEYIPGMIEGRYPEYPNEIMVTRPVAELLDLKIADEVTVSRSGKSSQYMITGIYQCISDTGVCFAIPLEGAKKIGIDSIGRIQLVLDDTANAEAMAEEINELCGEEAKAESILEEDGDTLYLAADILRYMVFGFAGVFSLAAVMMICSKAFIQERTDIGVLKSMGFTSKVLRRQFTLRFFVISLIGSVLGSLAAICWSDDVLSLIFRFFGIYKVFEDNTPMTFISAAAFIALCTAIFAFFSSRKIKKVETRELITE